MSHALSARLDRPVCPPCFFFALRPLRPKRPAGPKPRKTAENRRPDACPGSGSRAQKLKSKEFILFPAMRCRSSSGGGRKPAETASAARLSESPKTPPGRRFRTPIPDADSGRRSRPTPKPALRSGRSAECSYNVLFADVKPHCARAGSGSLRNAALPWRAGLHRSPTLHRRALSGRQSGFHHPTFAPCAATAG